VTCRPIARERFGKQARNKYSTNNRPIYLHYMDVSGQFHAPAALPPQGKSPRYPLNSRGQSGLNGGEKNLLLVLGIEPRFLSRPSRRLVAIPTDSPLGIVTMLCAGQRKIKVRFQKEVSFSLHSAQTALPPVQRTPSAFPLSSAASVSAEVKNASRVVLN
jgi:hypothetical protein